MFEVTTLISESCTVVEYVVSVQGVVTVVDAKDVDGDVVAVRLAEELLGVDNDDSEVDVPFTACQLPFCVAVVLQGTV